MLFAANVSVPVNTSDLIVLVVLALLFVAGFRIVIGFFKTGKKRRQMVQEMQSNTARVSRDRESTVAASQKMAADVSRSAGQQGVSVQVDIDGMMCGMCESHIADAIRKQFPDAKKVRASHTKGKASFLLKEPHTQADVDRELHSAIDPLGYDVRNVAVS